MPTFKKPEMAWTPEELERLPVAYQRAIIREHERAVENYKAKLIWHRQKQAEEKAKKARKAPA